MQNKTKPQATRNLRCRCRRYMVGKNAFLPGEDSQTWQPVGYDGVKLAVSSQQKP